MLLYQGKLSSIEFEPDRKMVPVTTQTGKQLPRRRRAMGQDISKVSRNRKPPLSAPDFEPRRLLPDYNETEFPNGSYIPHHDDEVDGEGTDQPELDSSDERFCEQTPEFWAAQLAEYSAERARSYESDNIEDTSDEPGVLFDLLLKREVGEAWWEAAPG
eukprot:CAMPEP_0196738010 /NCGR_PEP_ID=MMETSP1091-20130531/15556_1 /TAXON_ID=302021 /ORGANISM="Rhodomonas sp., Strain CCMP768" /LENGTH=158 /DNA_ID=CAMNT_0042081939 /DNA_START=238 /DNA_END=715 /DNA_ORIENTATION=+